MKKTFLFLYTDWIESIFFALALELNILFNIREFVEFKQHTHTHTNAREKKSLVKWFLYRIYDKR